MTLAVLNEADRAEAAALLRQCCTSQAWINEMVAQRPFASAASLHRTADEVWSSLEEPDFLEAFEGHPKIGDVDSLKEKYASTKALAAGEQSRVADATDEIIAALAQENSAYFDRFGFIFIVFATGKSAAEMLALLRSRLGNSRDQEVANAAEEQRKILQLRLEKLI